MGGLHTYILKHMGQGGTIYALSNQVVYRIKCFLLFFKYCNNNEVLSYNDYWFSSLNLSIVLQVRKTKYRFINKVIHTTHNIP